ncbi:hypothetical protein CMK17_15140 [Candidatus Poribacteria bacterium]|nr:hypothetical protein [Candidatus Poribacteria bacterium]
MVFGVEIRFHGNQPREAGGENARSPGGVKKLSPSLALLFGLDDEQTWPRSRSGGADEDGVASAAQIEDDGLGSLQHGGGKRNVEGATGGRPPDGANHLSAVTDADRTSRSAMWGGDQTKDDLLVRGNLWSRSKAAELQAQ